MHRARTRPAWRAAAVIWAAHARRALAGLAAPGSRLAPVLLVLAGLGGALLGGALIGQWCLGLILIAESAGAIAAGLLRDDGTGRPSPHEPPTVGQVLERARQAP